MLAETEARAYADGTWDRFARARDESLFHRLEFLSLGDVGDRAARLAAATAPPGRPWPSSASTPTGRGRGSPTGASTPPGGSQIAADGATLLLVVADGRAERSDFAGALRALDRAGRVGPRSPVVVRRRAACLRRWATRRPPARQTARPTP